MFLHLEQFISAHGVDVASLELLLENLGNRDLTEVGADAEHVAVDDEGVLVVGHLGREGGLHLLLGRVVLALGRHEVSVELSVTHDCLLFILYN
jgi:hypothetical protein